MTDYDNNAQAIIDTAIAAADPVGLNDGGRFFSVVIPDGGRLEVIDLEEKLDLHREAPRRKTGTYQVHDAETLVAYLAKHGDLDSEVWADVVGSKITAVLNAHRSADDGEHAPRWEDHRVAYQVKHTEAWQAWIGHDGKLMSQTDFAEHIEDRAIDIVVPSGAEMLELAQTIQATIGVSFESSKRLSSGERQLEYRETVDAKAGKKGQLDIPETFALAVRPFEGADTFKVVARLRYRIDGGNLRIGYRLERPNDVLREAFLSVVATVEERVEQTVFRGVR